jgi:hypothetical protein
MLVEIVHWWPAPVSVGGEWGPLDTRDWEPMTIALQALSLVENAETVQVQVSCHAWGTDGVCECKMGVQVYMDSCMALNGSCFMVTWVIFENRLLEVSLTWNRETMVLRTFTTVDLFYSIMWEDPHERKFIEMQPLVEVPVTHDFTLHLRSVTTLYDFEGVLGWPLDTFFWALTISWSRLLARVWSGPC